MAVQQYTIGRGAECTIRIDDVSQRVSRNHATLTVVSSKKMHIVDHSTNGTFVNGIKISPGIEFPVQKGDDISFANVSHFDWNTMPKGGNVGLVILIIVAALLVIGGGVGAYFYLNSDKKMGGSGFGTTIDLIDGDRQKQIDLVEQDSISRRKLNLDKDDKRDKLEAEIAAERAAKRRAEEIKLEKKRTAAAAKEAERKAAEAAAEAEEKAKRPTLVF